ncbi:hypothetical protein VT85_05385 [Planctomyces sp. SH-PL62]|nr:hypothetical protein VT85_05385 [Planctomyces sp. SH-PL62]
MRKSKFTEGQILFALRWAEAGPGIEETRRKPGVSQETAEGRPRGFGM